MLREEYRQRLAKEYRYAVTKMQQEQIPPRKLFYFSTFFGEAQRVLNWEWDRDLALVHQITQQTHAQITTTTQGPALVILPIDGSMLYEQLTKMASDLASYYEKSSDDTDSQELYQILGRLAELAYAAGGNGAYLYEKGVIKLV